MDPRAQAPERATAGSAGADLHALLDEVLTIPPGGRAAVPTGIAIGLPSPETVGLVFARSGLAVKHGLALSNGVGVIDSDYTGEIRVGLVIMPVCLPHMELADSLKETERGGGGFGSTGRQ